MRLLEELKLSQQIGLDPNLDIHFKFLIIVARHEEILSSLLNRLTMNIIVVRGIGLSFREEVIDEYLKEVAHLIKDLEKLPEGALSFLDHP